LEGVEKLAGVEEAVEVEVDGVGEVDRRKRLEVKL
jgi:hypothetical protein